MPWKNKSVFSRDVSAGSGTSGLLSPIGCSWLSSGSVLFRSVCCPWGCSLCQQALPGPSMVTVQCFPCASTHHTGQLQCYPVQRFASGWLGCRQQAESIHHLHSPEIKLSEQLSSHCYAAQPSQWSFPRKQNSKEHFGAAEAEIPNGICGHRALDSH